MVHTDAIANYRFTTNNTMVGRSHKMKSKKKIEIFAVKSFQNAMVDSRRQFQQDAYTKVMPCCIRVANKFSSK